MSICCYRPRDHKCLQHSRNSLSYSDDIKKLLLLYFFADSERTKIGLKKLFFSCDIAELHIIITF